MILRSWNCKQFQVSSERIALVIIRLSPNWDNFFAAVKTFDANRDNIANFVLMWKTRIFAGKGCGKKFPASIMWYSGFSTFLVPKVNVTEITEDLPSRLALNVAPTWPFPRMSYFIRRWWQWWCILYTWGEMSKTFNYNEDRLLIFKLAILSCCIHCEPLNSN